MRGDEIPCERRDVAVMESKSVLIEFAELKLQGGIAGECPGTDMAKTGRGAERDRDEQEKGESFAQEIAPRLVSFYCI